VERGYSGGDWKGHAEGSPEASPFWGLRPSGRPLPTSLVMHT
jgi:hypothetical protein